MPRLLFSIFLLSLFSCTQSPRPSEETELATTYTQAIGDFIKAANPKNASKFDTLFIAKRKNGQADDFPEIELPATIENTVIKLISPELGERSQKECKARIYINLIGWVEKEKAEFIFVVFSNGFEHQYDYNVNYKLNAKSKGFELEKVKQ